MGKKTVKIKLISIKGEKARGRFYDSTNCVYGFNLTTFPDGKAEITFRDKSHGKSRYCLDHTPTEGLWEEYTIQYEDPTLLKVLNFDYDGKHNYEVFIIDEWNNIMNVWFCDNLKDVEPEINNVLKDYKICEGEENEGETPQIGEGKNCGPLVEYTSTFGPCAEKMIDIEEGCIQIRVFIFNSQL